MQRGCLSSFSNLEKCAQVREVTSKSVSISMQKYVMGWCGLSKNVQKMSKISRIELSQLG